MNTRPLAIAAALLAAFPARAQQPATADDAKSGTALVKDNDPENPRDFLGSSIPLFNPDDENFTWDGKTWNIASNRIIRTRFEKYLSTRESDSEEDREYRATISQILEALSPHNRTSSPDSPLQQAVALLPKASRHKIDANLCDSISQVIFTVWLARKNVNALAAANEALEKESRDLHWNLEVAMSEDKLEAGSGSVANQAKGGGKQPRLQQTASRIGRITSYLERLAEIKAIKAANRAKMGVSETQSKVEFQALIMQLAVQRRFEHVLIATDMYSRLFGDGDKRLAVEPGSDVDKMLGRGLGVNPTITTLNTFAREAIRDVDEGVDAFNDLVERDELESATQQLMQAFFIGEYLPKIRTLEQSKKRRVLAFTRDMNLLLNAMQFRDFAEAAAIIERMREEARDFDYSQAKAGITVHTTMSDAAVMQAKIAAQNGDMEEFNRQMAVAAEAWPGNPRIREAGEQFSVLADRQIQTLNDLARLQAQRDYHAIAADFGRFAAAVADDPQKRAELHEVMEKVQTIEFSIKAAEEIANSGNPYGAWERIVSLTTQFPDDPKLNHLALNLTTRVGEFVSTLDRAKRLEESNQVGSSLAWYLRARRQYPRSAIAEAGIERMLDKMLPADNHDIDMGVDSGKSGRTPVSTPTDPGLDL